MTILQKIKNLILSYYRYVLYFFIFTIFVMMFIDSYKNIQLLCSNKKETTIISNPPYEANYSSDMNFLECVGEQHACLYKNLNNQIDYKIILEKCKNEKYCNENSRSVLVRIPR